MARISLFGYVFFSVCCGAISILYAWAEHEQFYPTVVSLTSSKTHVLVMGNLGLALAMFWGSIWQQVLFGQIADDESREVLDKAKYTFIDICIALTIFRTDLTVTVVCLFMALLFAKVFHWLAELRVETVSRLPLTQTYKIIQIVCSLSILIVLDIIVVFLFLYIIIQMDSFGVLVLFTFEFTILLFSICSNFLRFFILLTDNHYENEWKWKFTLLFYAEFTFDVARLTAYLGFFIVITKNWSFPLHLMRELYMAFATVRRRFQKYFKYKRLVKALESRFPKVTGEQLESATRDKTCIICRSDIDEGIQLPCGHSFHVSCLKLWFQESTTCPTCRLDLSGDLNALPQVNQVAPPPAQPNAAAAPDPAAPADAPAPARPVQVNGDIFRRGIAQMLGANRAPAPQPAENAFAAGADFGRPPEPVGHNNNFGQNWPFGAEHQNPEPQANFASAFRSAAPQNNVFMTIPTGIPTEPNLEYQLRQIENTTLATQSSLMYHQLLANHYENLLTDLITLQKHIADEKIQLEKRQNAEAEKKNQPPVQTESAPATDEKSDKVVEDEEDLEDKDEEPVPPEEKQEAQGDPADPGPEIDL